MFKGLQGTVSLSSPWEQAPDWPRNPSCQKSKATLLHEVGSAQWMSCLGHQEPTVQRPETSANIDVKKGAFYTLEGRSEGWESYRSKEQKSRLPIIFGHRVEVGIEGWPVWVVFFFFWREWVVRWGWWLVREWEECLSGELASPPLAGTLPIESTIAENVLSSHMGDNTPRLTA